MADNLPARYRQGQVASKVTKNGNVAINRVAAVSNVAQAALVGMLNVSMARREAELLAPEDAAKFDLIATQAAIALSAQVRWVSARW